VRPRTTVAAPRNLDAFVVLPKREGTMTLVGAPAPSHLSQKINEAFERMLKSDVKHRFVIDMTSLRRTVQAA
jgi:alcohol dehydrogenase (NADP+)